MVRFAFALEIARPLHEVWEYLTDPERVPEWQSSCVAAHRLDDGPMRAGVRIADERRFMGRKITSTVEVSEYEPEHVFTLKGISGPVRFEVQQTLEPNEDGTRVSIDAHADSGGLSRFTAPLVAHHAEREMRADFERLKQKLES